MRVSVAVATPASQDVVDLDLPEGATVAEALAAARFEERHPEVAAQPWSVGIWSRPCAAETRLREGDRVEVYREIRADAKQMRRARATLKPSKRSRNGP